MFYNKLILRTEIIKNNLKSLYISLTCILTSTITMRNIELKSNLCMEKNRKNDKLHYEGKLNKT